MGRLVYNSTLQINLDDRTLAHIQAIIQAKLRRNESFYVTWTDEPLDGRNVIWLHPNIPLSFRFGPGPATRLNPTWLEELITTAYNPTGLHITPEPPQRPKARHTNSLQTR